MPAVVHTESSQTSRIHVTPEYGNEHPSKRSGKHSRTRCLPLPKLHANGKRGETVHERHWVETGSCPASPRESNNNAMAPLMIGESKQPGRERIKAKPGMIFSGQLDQGKNWDWTHLHRCLGGE